jgi:hypothetical protein
VTVVSVRFVDVGWVVLTVALTVVLGLVFAGVIFLVVGFCEETTEAIVLLGVVGFTVVARVVTILAFGVVISGRLTEAGWVTFVIVLAFVEAVVAIFFVV